MPDNEQLRLMTKVARLYHTHAMRQVDIAARLHLSQSRVSRLLTQAQESGLVRTVVAVPPHINGDLEDAVERAFPVDEVHVVDVVGDDEAELGRDLAHTMALLLSDATFEAPTIAVVSWSRTLRAVIDDLQPLRTKSTHVVEMLGDLGPPQLQHDAARSTQRLAHLAGAQAVYLRTPGVVAAPEVRDLLVGRDVHTQRALQMLDDIDLALIGIGACEVDPNLISGDNFFTHEHFAAMRERGAVGEVCLHFIDAEGVPVDGELDGLVIGATSAQVRSARRRWAVAGGLRKRDAVKAAARGGWIDTLVTDTATAEYLLA